MLDRLRGMGVGCEGVLSGNRRVVRVLFRRG